VSSTAETGVLLGVTALMLFGPKFLGGIDAMLEPGRTKKFGGTFRMWVSMFLESVFSALLAPILMLFHTKFVVMTVFGRGVRWATQNRGEGTGTVWRDAWAVHSWQTMVGFVWGAVVWLFAPDLLPWFLPILLGMVFSIPFSVWTSRNCLGAFARRRGWFVTPHETEEPSELEATRIAMEQEPAQPAPRMGELDEEKGLLRAVLDPFVNAVHICLLRERLGQAEEIRRDFETSRERLLADGPAALGRHEKLTLLSDPESLEWLHHELWTREPAKLSPWWRLALRFHRFVHPAA
jgi:membrane glycosyltransferase